MNSKVQKMHIAISELTEGGGMIGLQVASLTFWVTGFISFLVCSKMGW